MTVEERAEEYAEMQKLNAVCLKELVQVKIAQAYLAGYEQAMALRDIGADK